MAAVALAGFLATETSFAARKAAPLKPAVPFAESELVERGLMIVRLDPKFGASPDACDELSAQDLVVTMGGAAAKVTSVERVPRPERHWLLLDVSGSTEGAGRTPFARLASTFKK